MYNSFKISLNSFEIVIFFKKVIKSFFSTKCPKPQNISYCESHWVQLDSLPTRGMLLSLVNLSTLKLAPHMAPSLSTLGIGFTLFIGCSKLIKPPSLWNIHPAHPQTTIHVRTMLSFHMKIWEDMMIYIASTCDVDMLACVFG